MEEIPENDVMDEAEWRHWLRGWPEEDIQALLAGLADDARFGYY